VIPNALDPEEMTTEYTRFEMRGQLGYDEEALVIGIVGRLSPEKGHRLFLRALAAARRQNPRLRGLIVGDGQEMNALRTTANCLGLGDACAFIGHVGNPASYYRAMDILAMPSFTEGMPNAALEGMFMGLPLIATRVGGIPEVVVDDETGLLIPPGHENSLADAMLSLAASKERREAMGRAGVERIRNSFSPQIRASRILGIYNELLTDKNRREAPL
jgi:glycosyltransferase involved in cell wall biosynthesis